MAEESQPQSSPSTSEPQTPPSSPVQSGNGQQGATPLLPISPFTGEPYDPEWGALLKKGNGFQEAIQQVMKPEIVRKDDQK